MKLSIIGAGYVGLVSGVCFAELGHSVSFVEKDTRRLSQLRKGLLPIYEPQLDGLFVRNVKKGRLFFHRSLEKGTEEASVIFFTLPTPPLGDGSSDLSHVLSVSAHLAEVLPMDAYRVIVNKSTTPIGTATRLKTLIQSRTRASFDVVSNPEFLREGAAVEDFMHPDRIIIGTSSPRAESVMRKLYASFSSTPLRIMNENSAELAKYAANVFLATRISFINEIAHLCEIMGADISSVQEAMSFDKRIGKHYFSSGVGYGGSCLPKDVAALSHSAEQKAHHSLLLQAVAQINTRQRLLLWNKAKKYFSDDLHGRCFAIWGVAFKPHTDDIREAPALYNISVMLQAGIRLRVHDPHALENLKHHNVATKGEIYYAKDPKDALQEAEALFVFTQWEEYQNPDWKEVHARMKRPLILDGRSMYSPTELKKEGFTYYGIGAMPV